MLCFDCSQCGAKVNVPQNYQQPYMKCVGCGSLEKIPLPSGHGPKYKVLDDKERARVELGVKNPTPVVDDFAEDQETGNSSEAALEKSKRRNLPVAVAPVVAAKKTSSGWPVKQPDFKKIKKPLDPKKFLVDALGNQGLEMVYEMVAGYLIETDEAKKKAKKARVLRTLMKSKVSGDMASQAIEYAEKSPETMKALWNNYKSGLILGLGVFGLGILLSTLVHFIANPGRGFYLFQVPFAVGFAYAANSALNMAGLKFAGLRSDLVHYAFMTFMTLIIGSYVVWGIYF